MQKNNIFFFSLFCFLDSMAPRCLYTFIDKRSFGLVKKLTNKTRLIATKSVLASLTIRGIKPPQDIMDYSPHLLDILIFEQLYFDYIHLEVTEVWNCEIAMFQMHFWITKYKRILLKHIHISADQLSVSEFAHLISSCRRRLIF